MVAKLLKASARKRNQKKITSAIELYLQTNLFVSFIMPFANLMKYALFPSPSPSIAMPLQQLRYHYARFAM